MDDIDKLISALERVSGNISRDIEDSSKSIQDKIQKLYESSTDTSIPSIIKTPGDSTSDELIKKQTAAIAALGHASSTLKSEEVSRYNSIAGIFAKKFKEINLFQKSNTQENLEKDIESVEGIEPQAVNIVGISDNVLKVLKDVTGNALPAPAKEEKSGGGILTALLGIGAGLLAWKALPEELKKIVKEWTQKGLDLINPILKPYEDMIKAAGVAGVAVGAAAKTIGHSSKVQNAAAKASEKAATEASKTAAEASKAAQQLKAAEKAAAEAASKGAGVAEAQKAVSSATKATAEAQKAAAAAISGSTKAAATAAEVTKSLGLTSTVMKSIGGFIGKWGFRAAGAMEVFEGAKETANIYSESEQQKAQQGMSQGERASQKWGGHAAEIGSLLAFPTWLGGKIVDLTAAGLNKASEKIFKTEFDSAKQISEKGSVKLIGETAVAMYQWLGMQKTQKEASIPDKALNEMSSIAKELKAQGVLRATENKSLSREIYDLLKAGKTREEILKKYIPSSSAPTKLETPELGSIQKIQDTANQIADTTHTVKQNISESGEKLVKTFERMKLPQILLKQIETMDKTNDILVQILRKPSAILADGTSPQNQGGGKGYAGNMSFSTGIMFDNLNAMGAS